MSLLVLLIFTKIVELLVEIASPLSLLYVVGIFELLTELVLLHVEEWQLFFFFEFYPIIQRKTCSNWRPE
jgi:hypothetical protein